MQQRYGLEGPVRCELLHRGMNDVYQVRTERARFAVRAWRAGWRSFEDVAYELEFLQHLDAREIPVAPPLPASDGSTWFTVDAPEGERALAMFRWAPGRKFGACATPERAHELGRLFARMHLVSRGFVPTTTGRRRTNPPSNLRLQLPNLLELVSDRPDDLRDYPGIVERVATAIEAVTPDEAPMGPTHGDFHFNNAHVDDAGTITLLDFDNAGEDFLAQDVMCYAWGNLYGGLDQAYVDRFLDGYQELRPMGEQERELLPLFLLAKEVRLICGFSTNINATGFFPLRFRDLDWFSNSIRQHATAAGLY